MTIDSVEKWLAMAIKYELHAFILIFTGAGLYLYGAKELGASAFSAGLAIFKGSK